MKLRRRQQPPGMDPAFAEVVVTLYYAFEDSLALCARLSIDREDSIASEARDEALGGARRIAYVCRMAFELIAHRFPLDSIPEDVLPLGVFGALARLAYALEALAEAEPEPEALLSAAELDGLIGQYEIGDWVSWCRSSSPEPPS